MRLRDIVGRVNEWANWRLRVQASALGYPSSAPEARVNAGSSGPPGPIVPDVVMNPRASEVDRAIREMPADMRMLIEHKHLDGTGSDLERARLYCTEYDLSLSTYYRREKDAYWFIGGCLTVAKRSA